MNKAILTALILILVILTAGIGYFIYQNQKLTSQLSKTPQEQQTTIIQAPTPQPSPTTFASPSPKTPTINDIYEAIKTNTNQKDHKGLMPYLASPKVNFIIMSSSCCEPKTAAEAIDALKYIDDGITLDFNQNSTLVKTLKSKNDRLKDAYIGLSQTKEHLVAYTLNAKNEIAQIEVSVSYKFYQQ